MNSPKNQNPTKRRNIKSWMMSRQRRLYWKNRVNPQLHIAQRIDQLAKQVTANDKAEPRP